MSKNITQFLGKRLRTAFTAVFLIYLFAIMIFGTLVAIHSFGHFRVVLAVLGVLFPLIILVLFSMELYLVDIKEWLVEHPLYLKKRIKTRLRNYYRSFKLNWRLFKESKIGIFGLGIIIFFSLLAIFAPYMHLRDPLYGLAPDSDVIVIDNYWSVNSTYFGKNITEPALHSAPSSAPGCRVYKLYLGSDEGLYAIDTAKSSWQTYPYRSLWHQDVGRVPAPPIVSTRGTDVKFEDDRKDDIVYAGTTNGMIYAFHAPDGSIWWNYQTDSVILASPALDEVGSGTFETRNYDTIYVTTESGSIYKFTDDYYFDDSWLYDASSDSWTKIEPALSPPARRNISLAYDPIENHIILFGGKYRNAFLDDTWVYNITNNTWTEKQPIFSPSGRENYAVAYDSYKQKVILFGGRFQSGDDLYYYNQTYFYNNTANNWEEIMYITAPSPRSGHAMAYDANSYKLVLFGGFNGLYNGETWVYDSVNDSWVKMTPNLAPPARSGHSMVYDASNDRIVLFGGYSASGLLGDTWVYDVDTNTWINMNPSQSPSARQKFAMAYDLLTKRIILFGGYGSSDSYFNDTWVYDLANNTWTQNFIENAPYERFGHSIVFDSEGKGLMFGGYNKVRLLWKVNMGSPIKSKPLPVYYKGCVGITAKGKLYALNSLNGSIKWSFSPAIDNIDASDDDDTISDTASPVTSFYYQSSLSYVASEYPNIPIYASSKLGRIYVINASDGKQLNVYRPPAFSNPTETEPIRAFSTPLVEDNDYRLWVGCENGYVYAFSAQRTDELVRPTGTLRWKYQTLGSITSTPAHSDYVAKEYIYVASNDGRLYAFSGEPEVKKGEIGAGAFATFYWRATVQEGGRLNSPVLFNNFGLPDQYTKEIATASSLDGYFTGWSVSGEYLAPLPPTWYVKYLRYERGGRTYTEPPSGNYYWLGTDTLGRDVFSQLIWGSRVALIVGLGAAFFSVVIGVTIGLISGYFGGRLDMLLMRITDIVLVLPLLPLQIILAVLLGPSIVNIIIVIAILGWPGIARVIRAEVLSLKERPYIDSARVTGASHSRIIFNHLTPNVLPLAFLFMTFAVTTAILLEAALAFIGLVDPNHVSWGMMMHYALQENVIAFWWWILPPGLCVTILSLGFYLVGRAFEQIINPRLRRRR